MGRPGQRLATRAPTPRRPDAPTHGPPTLAKCRCCVVGDGGMDFENVSLAWATFSSALGGDSLLRVQPHLYPLRWLRARLRWAVGAGFASTTAGLQPMDFTHVRAFYVRAAPPEMQPTGIAPRGTRARR
jgi:hypothetical protein